MRVTVIKSDGTRLAASSIEEARGPAWVQPGDFIEKTWPDRATEFECVIDGPPYALGYGVRVMPAGWRPPGL